MPEFICSVFSLAATIVIAFIQIYQSKRMEVFERRQDERDALIIDFIRTPPTFIRTCTDECGNPIP